MSLKLSVVDHSPVFLAPEDLAEMIEPMILFSPFVDQLHAYGAYFIIREVPFPCSI